MRASQLARTLADQDRYTMWCLEPCWSRLGEACALAPPGCNTVESIHARSAMRRDSVYANSIIWDMLKEFSSTARTAKYEQTASF